MKTIKTLLVVSLIFTFVSVNSQTLSLKEQERENNEVEILTQEEKDEIQLWFHYEKERMNMSEEKLNEYDSNLLVYISKMMRLDDKDQDYTNDEIIVEYEKLTSEMNDKIKTILSEEQYEIHETNFKIVLNFIKLKFEGSHS